MTDGAVPGWPKGKSREELASEAAAQRAEAKRWREVRTTYNAEAGHVLSDKEFKRRYIADQRGEDWRSAPIPRTSGRNQILKGVALVVLFPFMFVAPRTTQSLLERIDHSLSA